LNQGYSELVWHFDSDNLIMRALGYQSGWQARELLR